MTLDFGMSVFYRLYYMKCKHKKELVSIGCVARVCTHASQSLNQINMPSNNKLQENNAMFETIPFLFTFLNIVCSFCGKKNLMPCIVYTFVFFPTKICKPKEC